MMSRAETGLLDFARFDTLARGDSLVHRLDPRAKVITVLVYAIALTSFGKYDVTALAPMALYVIWTISAGRLPLKWLAGKVLLASPFALMLGAANPIMDTAPLVSVMGIEVSGGWISLAALLCRFCLSLIAALALVATTGFDGVCASLTRLHAPRAFVMQLALLHRYISVLGEETTRIVRGWRQRAGDQRRPSLRLFTLLLGGLLARSVDRSQRVHQAMLARGFQGEMQSNRPMTFRAVDWAYMCGWVSFFTIARTWNLPELLGKGFLVMYT